MGRYNQKERKKLTIKKRKTINPLVGEQNEPDDSSITRILKTGARDRKDSMLNQSAIPKGSRLNPDYLHHSSYEDRGR